MAQLKVGYASVNVNPSLGIAINGYYVPRFAKGFLDDITASALTFSLGKKKIVIINIDNCGLDNEHVELVSELIEKKTGINAGDVFISSTHSHTCPLTSIIDAFVYDHEPVLKYRDFVTEKLLDVVTMSLENLKDAKMGYAVAKAPDRIAYIRRYKMKDGMTMTCPPVNDPNIDYPIGELDQRVNVLRFDREGDDSVVILNYGLHADTVNGELISSDWVGWVRRTLDKALDGVKCLCVMGAQGDVGSTNVHPTKSDMNDTEISFDNEMKSPGMARFVGRALAGSVLQVYDKVEYVDVDDIQMVKKILTVPANVPKKEDLPRAKQYKEWHDIGRDDLIPFKAMELTTVVAEAVRMCRMENGPDHYELCMSGIKLGPVALVGIPGEPFTEIGVKIKEIGGFDLIMLCALTNGYNGYFPNRGAFDEGGYEARSSNFKAGVGELMIKECKKLLTELR